MLCATCNISSEGSCRTTSPVFSSTTVMIDRSIVSSTRKRMDRSFDARVSFKISIASLIFKIASLSEISGKSGTSGAFSVCTLETSGRTSPEPDFADTCCAVALDTDRSDMTIPLLPGKNTFVRHKSATSCRTLGVSINYFCW